jgi:hypothetical protein
MEEVRDKEMNSNYYPVLAYSAFILLGITIVVRNKSLLIPISRRILSETLLAVGLGCILFILCSFDLQTIAWCLIFIPIMTIMALIKLDLIKRK